MEIKEIKERLDTVGIPLAYDHFKEQTNPPFLVYLLPESRNILADDSVYQQKSLVRVQLYTGKKDLLLEEQLEAALQGLLWWKTETYIDKEDMFEMTYEMEVLLT